MKIIKSYAELHAWRKSLAGLVGFVPTMGALHEGHLEIVRLSVRENQNTVVSIFVNPTQFNEPKDYEQYPITIEEDLEMLEREKCSAVFLPDVGELYADKFRYHVSETDESKVLCGPHRPGHFTGVLTIVLKLLGMVKADRAYFGEKDFQQLKLIEGMVKAFFLETDIVAVPTVREESGLALSSRNRRLKPVALAKAKIISKLLNKKSMKVKDVRAELEKEGFDVDYVSDHWNRRFVAARIDGVRLIDNAPL